ncbi:putative 11-S seed storage protein, plant [Helianthus annuus]|nr:putative 11-S seed storage protein, plant [Helianthus annuus]
MSLLSLLYLTAQTMLINLIQATRFFLAGNSQGEQVQQIEQPRSWENLQQDRSLKKGSDNIFKGFTTETIAESFNVDHETAELLRGESDQRGHIVFVEKGLQVIQPPMRHEEQEYRGGPRANGVEETICSMKLRVNIDDPSEADLYNPQAGRCTRSQQLQVPHSSVFATQRRKRCSPQECHSVTTLDNECHNIIYVTDGYMRIQIVNDQGQEVFNDVLQEQQLVVVPQNFAVAKQAGEQGS